MRNPMRKLIFLVPLLVVVFAVSTANGQQQSGQATYTLKPTPKTVAWGYYDAKTAPVLRVKSGDTVEIQTLHEQSEAAGRSRRAAGSGGAIAARHHRSGKG